MRVKHLIHTVSGKSKKFTRSELLVCITDMVMMDAAGTLHMAVMVTEA